MAYSAEFDDLLADGISVDPLASWSTDGFGTPVFSTTASTYKARILRKQTLVRTFAGTEELATTVVWIASTSTANFSPDSKIRAAGSTATIGPLMSVEAYPDEDGVHHLKAYFG
jgi:hypothetical protein